MKRGVLENKIEVRCNHEDLPLFEFVDATGAGTMSDQSLIPQAGKEEESSSSR